MKIFLCLPILSTLVVLQGLVIISETIRRHIWNENCQFKIGIGFVTFVTVNQSDF